MKKRYIMEERKIIYILVGLILVYFLLIIGITSIKTYNSKEDISKDWKCSIDGEIIKGYVDIDNKFSNLKEGSIIKFSKTLKKDKNIIYPMICGSFIGCDVDVMLDGQQIYRYEYVKSIIGKKYANFKMLSDYDNKQLDIVLTLKDDDRAMFVEKLKLIEENEIITVKSRDNLLSIIVGGLGIIFGIMTAVIAFCVKEENYIITRAFWSGVLLIFMGMYLYIKMDVWVLLFEDSILLELLMYVCVVGILPCLGMLHIYMFYDEKIKKYFMWVMFITMIIIGSIVILNTFFGTDIDLEKVSVIGLIVLDVIMFILIKLDYKNANYIDKMFFKGMYIVYGIFLAVAIGGIIFKYSVTGLFYEDITRNIIILLLDMYLIYFIYNIKEYIEKITEEKIASALVYTDPLTGIMNRTKYEELIDEITTSHVKDYTIVIMDLNNLKILNDKNGHDAGDCYIKTFAKVLRIGFEDECFIARIGGDEFVAVLVEKYIDIEDTINKMQRLLQEKMEKYYQNYEFSFAYGSASSSKKSFKDIEEIIKLADEKMYRYKKEQKINRI